MTDSKKSIFSNKLIKDIRDKFVNVDSDPVTGKRIYFENAGGTLKLKSVLNLINYYTALPDNLGRENKTSKKLDEIMDKSRKDIALFLGAKSGKVIADQSVTGMIFRLLNNIAYKKNGNNIVTSNLDHASVYDATHFIAKRHNLEARIAELDPVKGNVSVDSIIKCIDNKTVALTIIHASNILGTRNDVANIVREVRKINPDIYIIIDGAQHSTHGAINVEEYGADAYIFVPYKTYSKIGISFAHVSDRLSKIEHENLSGKPENFWDLGTREIASYASMTEVVEYIKWLGSNFANSKNPRKLVVEGMNAIRNYEKYLLEVLLYGTGVRNGLLSHNEIKIHGEKEDLDNREAIIAFNIDNLETKNIVEYFEDNKVRIANRISNAYSRHTLSALGINECLRLSFAHYNTMEEIDYFLILLDSFLKQKHR
ncbi:MAG: aminotransferase class V-fold PLP-dependent enzyme [Actinobacteria bacterium]|nr:aminotransferase class V-fold PLP-dependent enzyme [Actinomycetota bacterium]